jgi:hypothetical protein
MNEDDEYRIFLESQMRHLMDVFTTQGSSTSRYDVPAGTGIRCLLQRVGTGRAATVTDRTQMMRIRTLSFPVSFVMPTRSRVVIDGKTWQVSADTIDVVEGPLGNPIARTCDLSSADRPIS